MPSTFGVLKPGDIVGVRDSVAPRESWNILGRSSNSPAQNISGGLGSYVSVNGSLVLDEGQQLTLQSVAFGVSSVSLVAAFLAIYWFCMMRRSFRRDLILLLVAGGTWKSLWFVLFGAVEFTYGHVSANGAFCRVSGYMLEVSFESCDLAILFMSLHLFLQIFPSSRTALTNDGLYPFRHTVFAVWLILPNICASLAFINPADPYTVAGGFCFLPLRPFWYRLALFWIPRYLIWIFIMYVVIRIYLHVGGEFKVFALRTDDDQSLAIPGLSIVQPAETHQPAGGGINKPTEDLAIPRFSDIAWTNPTENSTVDKADAGAQSSKFSVPHATLINFATTPFTPKLPMKSQFTDKAQKPPTQAEAGVHNNSRHSHTSGASQTSANAAIEQRRHAIQRQLRLLFIYPCIYMIMWVIPSISHFMNYSDYYAQHPVFVLSVLQVICLTLMTLVDVLVFSSRERPWRQIAGADGTFLGSLCWWRIVLKHEWRLNRKVSTADSIATDYGQEDKVNTSTGIGGHSNTRSWLRKGRNTDETLPTTAAPSHQQHKPRRPSLFQRALPRPKAGRSDRQQLAIDRAYERLALERAEYEADYRAMQNQRRNSGFHSLGLGQRQWFDHEFFALAESESASPPSTNVRHPPQTD